MPQKLKSIVLLPKYLGKVFLCRLLENQVRSLRDHHEFTLIAVAGSVGKTSTKLAIAKTLNLDKPVISQEGNFNDRLTVPLVLFNQDLPGLFNVWRWAKILIANKRMIKGPYKYKYAVVELGTDGPGQISKFAYLQPEITVVTAIAPEHMEYFKTLDAVAEEELTVSKFSKMLLVNSDDIPSKYLNGLDYVSYGLKSADYQATDIERHDLRGTGFNIKMPKSPNVSVKSPVIGQQGVKIALSAAAVANLLDLDGNNITKGLQSVQPFAGRMQIIEGIKNSTIIDDSYNASPTAVKAGLDVLYEAEATERIAILGSMNELGSFSPEAHREVGKYCNPKKLTLVVTIGLEAKQYLAPLATETGCKVSSFLNPHQAGDFVASRLSGQPTVILAEGSQNGVFAEEALKPLLKNAKDQGLLVRQSKYWLNIKDRQFGKV